MLARPRLTYIVKVPSERDPRRYGFPQLEPDVFDPEMVWNDRKIGRWTIAAHLNFEHEPGAWITFVRYETDAWRVADSHVRLRYRGAGLEEALWQKAEKILATGSSSFDAGGSGIRVSRPWRKN